MKKFSALFRNGAVYRNARSVHEERTGLHPGLQHHRSVHLQRYPGPQVGVLVLKNVHRRNCGASGRKFLIDSEPSRQFLQIVVLFCRTGLLLKIHHFVFFLGSAGRVKNWNRFLPGSGINIRSATHFQGM
jgi:hypothetical protein